MGGKKLQWTLSYGNDFRERKSVSIREGVSIGVQAT